MGLGDAGVVQSVVSQHKGLVFKSTFGPGFLKNLGKLTFETPPRRALRGYAPGGSEAGSYLRLIDFVYHSTLGLRVIKKREETLAPGWGLVPTVGRMAPTKSWA